MGRFSVTLWPLCPWPPWHLLAAGNADATWQLEWADCGQVFKPLWGFSLLWVFSLFAVVLVSGLQSPSWISHDLETCCHISHVFWIQMLWPKLSSELRLNHPSFSINRRTQLPAQLLRYFELQLHVLARLALLLLFHYAGKKKTTIKNWKMMYWFHVSYSIIKEVHFLSEFEGRRCYIVTYLQIH